MTLIADATTPVQIRRPRQSPGAKIVKVLTTTDHKTIGLLYLVTSFCFFLLAGGMAEIIRAELAQPGLQVVSPEQYNQLFTMHGTIMMFLFAPPAAYGFANFIMPLQIGAPDMSFPRLNAFSYWLYLFGGITGHERLPHPRGRGLLRLVRRTRRSTARSTTRRSARPLDHRPAGLRPRHDPRRRQLHHHDHHAARPGMTMFRMPIFTWNILVTSILVLFAFPVITAAFFALLADRTSGRRSTTPRPAARSCGSTCSGSSATPRSTSSRCRSSASSPRSSRCSAASRCSATRAWSSRPSPSARCR
jgi:cytochrome c oxidase subunit 1